MPKIKLNLGERFAKSVARGLTFTRFGGITWDGEAGWHTFGNDGAVRYPGSDMDWQSEAGVLWLNSVAMICAGYIFDKVVEPQVQVVYENDEGLFQSVENSQVSKLLAQPNPEYRGNALLQGLALSYAFDGNAYAVKVRGNNGTGVPQELYYIPHWQIEPVPPKDGGPTQFYAYKKPIHGVGVEIVPIPRANIIHIKNGIDPMNPRKGLSRTKAQYRPYVADSEIDSTIAIVLRNRGNIGTILSPDGAVVDIDPDVLKELKRKIGNQSQGDARGGIIAADFPIKIDRTTQSPNDLMLDKIGERAVKRICGSFGIDPAAVYQDASGGGKGGQYGAKQREARQSSYETCIIPMLSTIGEALTFELLTDFPKPRKNYTRKTSRYRKWVTRPSNLRRGVNDQGTNDITDTFRINFDYTDVRELADDEDAVSKRAVEEFKGNIATLDEARELTGKKPCEDASKGEKFAWELLPPPGGEFGLNADGTKPGDAPKTPTGEDSNAD